MPTTVAVSDIAKEFCNDYLLIKERFKFFDLMGTSKARRTQLENLFKMDVDSGLTFFTKVLYNKKLMAKFNLELISFSI